MNTLATTGNLVAANDINWNTFLPDKLVPAIFDTMYMAVSYTHLRAHET